MVGTRRSGDLASPGTLSSQRGQSSKRSRSRGNQSPRPRRARRMMEEKESDEETDEEDRLMAQLEEEDERHKAEDNEEESDPMKSDEEDVDEEARERRKLEEKKKAEEREKKRAARAQTRQKGKAILEMDFSPEPTPTAILAENKPKKGNAYTGLTPEWISMVDKLRSYKNQHGNTRVPNRYPVDPALAGWVKQQRKAYVKQQLSDGQRVSLEALGFEFIIESEDQPPLSWDESFEQLKIFKEKHGHCNIPHAYEEMPVLQFWTFFQREMYRQKKLNQEQIAKLEGLGFTWDHTISKEKAKPKSTDEVWNMQFEKLKAFKEKEGHCNVPGSYPPDPRFGRWIETQRTTYRRNQMPDERRKQLESLGFEWSRARTPRDKATPSKQRPTDVLGKSKDDIWRLRFNELKEFKAQNGQINVSSSFFADPVLGRWVQTQRTSYRRQQLPQDRIEALESIGFEWRLKDNSSAVNMSENDSNWEAMFEKLETYKEEYGDVNVPRTFPQDQILSRWVQEQRRAKQLGHMPEDRHHQLDLIGFVWDNSDNDTNVNNEVVWNLQFEKLKLFRELNGHTNVPKDYNMDPQFGRWVHMQRTAFRRNSMAEERKQALESIGFEFRIREGATQTEQSEIWNMQLEKLKIYKQANGHCNVPFSYSVDPALARWVATQRTTYRRKQMTEERIEALERIGFEWRLGPPSRTWGENFALLSSFRDTVGHPHFISKGSGDKSLQNWIVSQRQKFAKGILSQEQIHMLQSIGFAWTAEQEKSLLWDFQYDKLKQFYGEHGHLGTPEQFPEDPDLLEWISSQHQVYFAKKMPQENVEKLVAIGFVFNSEGHNASTTADEDIKPAAGSRVSWNKHFAALKAFKEIHGHTNVPRDYHDRRLFRWAHQQREMYAKGKGPKENRLEKLNSIEFDWSGEQGNFPGNTPPCTGTMALGAAPPTEVDVLMRAAEARTSPSQPHPKAAPTPVMTWARGDSQQSKTQSGVTQMAVRLEIERSKLEADNRQLKKSNQKLQGMNDTLTKRLTEVEATLTQQIGDLNEKMLFYDEQFRSQQESLEAHNQQLAALSQHGIDRYEEQLREQAHTIQSQGNQLTQLARELQDMRQVQYNLQHQVGIHNLSYRL